MEEQLSKILTGSKLLKNVDFSKINLDKIKGKLITLSEGEILYKEGDSADIIYLVVSGEINVLKKKLLGKSKSLILHSNDFFGQDEFFEETSRTSTAVALLDSYVIALTKEEIDDMIKQDDQVYVNLREQTVEINLDEIDTKIKQQLLFSSINRKANTPAKDEEKKETETGANARLFGLNFGQPDEEAKVEWDDFITDKENLSAFEAEKEKDDNSGKEDSGTSEETEGSEDKIEEDKTFGEEESLSRFTKTIVEESHDLNDALFRMLSTQEMPESTGESDHEPEVGGQKSEISSGESAVKDEPRQPSKASLVESGRQAGNGKTEGTHDEYSEEKYLKDETVFEEPLSEDVEFGSGAEEENEMEQKNENKNLSLTDMEIIKEVDEKLAWIEKVSSQNSNQTQNANNAVKIEQLKMIIAAAESVNSTIKIDDVLQTIVDTACSLTSADRGTLYLVDREKNEIWSKIAVGEKTLEIRLKLGEGLAGHVAKTGEIINSKNVHNDPRFNTDFDKISGYTTRDMICFPIKNRLGEIIGVIQLLNNKRGEFSKVDEEFLEALSIHSAIAIQNAEMVEKLLEIERGQTLGKMANFLIQDIKKPVLVSKRYAEHLASRNVTPEIKQVIDMLLEQLTQVSDLVQTISSYASGKAILRTIAVSLNKTLDDYASRMNSFVQSRNCVIEKEYDKDVHVKLDTKEFFLCFQHIIKNACDAMPESGRILISTKRDGSKVKISFKDNGLGIPEGVKDKIFEPFISHGKKEGTGLGLTITKKIVEAHNGVIEVESGLGEGTKVTITLPAASIY